MRKMIAVIMMFGCVSLSHADYLARAICLNSYTNALTKCGPQPSILDPLAYARWSVCVNAAITAYYACIAQSYFPFVDSSYSDSESELNFFTSGSIHD